MGTTQPRHKIIPGTGFIVDGFRHVSPNIRGYFLSHAHSDHYTGLSDNWQEGAIYCSDITARLIQYILGVNPKYIRPLPLDLPQSVCGVEVTLVDANHCPGAVQFLFRLPDGRRYIHCGDMRYEQSLQSNRHLQRFCSPTAMFLDTTYCHPRHSFPPQSESVEYVAATVGNRLQDKERRYAFVVETYSIGKERILLELHRRFGFRIHVTQYKMGLMACMDLQAARQTSDAFTLDESETPFHVVPFGRVGESWPFFKPNWNYMEKAAKKYGVNGMVAFVPTGWTYNPKKGADFATVRQKDGHEIHQVPYSEHSSFTELQAYVAWMRPAEVIPTVGVEGADSEKKVHGMLKHFRNLVDETSAKSRFLSAFTTAGNGFTGQRSPAADEQQAGVEAETRNDEAVREDPPAGEPVPPGGEAGPRIDDVTRVDDLRAQEQRVENNHLTTYDDGLEGAEAGPEAGLEGLAPWEEFGEVEAVDEQEGSEIREVDDARVNPAAEERQQGDGGAAAGGDGEAEACRGRSSPVVDVAPETAEVASAAGEGEERNSSGSSSGRAGAVEEEMPEEMAGKVETMLAVAGGALDAEGARNLLRRVGQRVEEALNLFFDGGGGGSRAAASAAGQGGLGAGGGMRKRAATVQRARKGGGGKRARTDGGLGKPAGRQASILGFFHHQGGPRTQSKLQVRDAPVPKAMEELFGPAHAGGSNTVQGQARCASAGSMDTADAEQAAGDLSNPDKPEAQVKVVDSETGMLQRAAASASTPAAPAGPSGGQAGAACGFSFNFSFIQGSPRAAEGAGPASGVEVPALRSAPQPQPQAPAVAAPMVEAAGEGRRPVLRLPALDGSLPAAAEVGGGRVEERREAFGSQLQVEPESTCGSQGAAPPGAAADAGKQGGRTEGMRAVAAEAALLPMAQYRPLLHAGWQPGQPAPYSHIANAFQAMDSTKKRLQIGAVLCNMFRAVMQLSPGDTLAAAYLTCGRLRPDHENLELKVGGATVAAALMEVTGTSRAQLRELYKAKGDLGDVAYACKRSQSTLFGGAGSRSTQLAIQGLYDRLLKLAQEKGVGSQARRHAQVVALLRAAGSVELKYLVRTLVQNLRVGANWRSVVAALSQAALMHHSGGAPVTKTQLQQAAEAGHAAFQVCPSLDQLLPALLDAGPSCLQQRCVLTPGVPLKPMLANPAEGPGPALAQLGADAVLAEFKYDGQRAQVHLLETGEVRIFSRNCEDKTAAFPDAAAALRAAVSPTVRTLVADAELVAVDRTDSNRIRTFQELSTRARGDVAPEDVSIQVCLFAFDLLFLDGAPLLHLPLRQRRNLLQGALPSCRPGFCQLAEAVEMHIQAGPGADQAARAAARTGQPAPKQQEPGDNETGSPSGSSRQACGGSGCAEDTPPCGPPVAGCTDAHSAPLPEAQPQTQQPAAHDLPATATDAARAGGAAVREASGHSAAEEALHEYLLEALSRSAEGLMLKRLDADSSYQPSKRNGSWLKLKKDYCLGMQDSLDLVPIGAWHGNGRKAGWFSPFLLACWDPEREEYQSLCRVMSGFTDAFYTAATARFKTQLRTSKPEQYHTGENAQVWFPPTEVWEIRGADISISPVHRAAFDRIQPGRGVSLRFPRFIRVREDKSPDEASGPELISSMYYNQTRRVVSKPAS